jgi:hypothetical protein
LEADWEFDLGRDSQLIDAAWPGFIDLRSHPERSTQISELSQLPALGDALVQLNSPSSPVWTSKCDVWRVEEFDADELDASPEQAIEAIACYVDLLPRSSHQWASPLLAEGICRALCAQIRVASLRFCRADLVIRRARVSAEEYTLGVTAYLTACGPTSVWASERLAASLAAIVRFATTLESNDTKPF